MHIMKIFNIFIAVNIIFIKYNIITLIRGNTYLY